MHAAKRSDLARSAERIYRLGVSAVMGTPETVLYVYQREADRT
jgi:hypothetical protein